MPTAETLRALIALVEEAKAGSRELDREIHTALGFAMGEVIHGGPLWNSYTTSIDAALALVAKVLPGWIVERMSDQATGRIGVLKPFGAHVEITDGDRVVVGQAATRPHAILAALLHALRRDLLQQSETAHVER